MKKELHETQQNVQAFNMVVAALKNGARYFV
jgi:hypothetical protein